jgi:hypothetical protein
VPIGSLIRVSYVVIDRFRISKLRKDSASAGFPLDRHMALVLTSQSLAMWSASRFPRRRNALLSERPLSEIKSVTVPFSSTGRWRTVVITQSNGLAVRFRVEASAAERLELAIAPE